MRLWMKNEKIREMKEFVEVDEKGRLKREEEKIGV